MSSPVIAIVSAVILVSAILTIVVTVLRYLVRKFDAETRAQQSADERYRASRKK